jgi:hypothetical protein
MEFKPKQRSRYGQYPVPAERADLYWGLKQSWLAGITAAQLARMIIDSEDFQNLIVPMLEGIDRRNRNGFGNTMGRPSRFTSLHLESVLIYRRCIGRATIKETRNALLLDQEAQELLDFQGGVPSLKTMSRYMRERLDPDERLGRLLEAERSLRQRVFRLPGFDTEAKILGMDGSRQGTKYTPPIPDPKKRKREKDAGITKPKAIVNGNIAPGEPRAITAPTAGFVGKKGGPKAGKGWQLMGLWTEHGTPVNWEISPLNESEKPAAERVLADYQREVLPHRGKKTLSVLTADGGFSNNGIRRLAQEARIIPNIHKASHKKDFRQPGEQTKNAQKRNEEWLPFEHPTNRNYGNWLANGHSELRCSCGKGKTKRADVIGKTCLSIAVKGHCSKCGNVTITVGQWRRDKDNHRWVRCLRGNEADLTLGNSLTFNDPLALEYGKDRFGFGESIHATLLSRFGLLEEDSRMRDLTEVKTEFAIAFMAISVLLLERASRQAEAEKVVPLAAPANEVLPLAA